MAVRVVPRSQLTATQLEHLTSRIFAAEHECDVGPRSVWDLASYAPHFYVALLADDSQRPIGTIYVGGPPHAIDVAWWVDSMYRGRGYGGRIVDALAPILKVRGVMAVGPIIVTAHGDDYAASAKLVKRLRRYFPPARFASMRR